MSMSYQIDSAKPVFAQFRQIFLEQLYEARESLLLYPEDPEGLHSTRKCIKRMRAMMRLVVKGPGKRVARKVNNRLAKIARNLSKCRDTEVLTKKLGEWERDLEAKPETRMACRKAIETWRGRDNIFGDGLTMLHRKGKGPLEADSTWSLLAQVDADILECGYQRGGKLMRVAYATYQDAPTAINLHTLRKRVKNHLYQTQLLGDILAQEEAYGSAIKRLEHLLGNARDCDMVVELLSAVGDTTVVDSNNQQLLDIAREEKALLVKDINLLWEEALRHS